MFISKNVHVYSHLYVTSTPPRIRALSRARTKKAGKACKGNQHAAQVRGDEVRALEHTRPAAAGSATAPGSVAWLQTR